MGLLFYWLFPSHPLLDPLDYVTHDIFPSHFLSLLTTISLSWLTDSFTLLILLFPSPHRMALLSSTVTTSSHITEQHAGEDESFLSNRKLPVLLFIHGDSLFWGSGNYFDGSFLSSSTNVIVITINYRLGVFGESYNNKKLSRSHSFLISLACSLFCSIVFPSWCFRFFFLNSLPSTSVFCIHGLSTVFLLCVTDRPFERHIASWNADNLLSSHTILHLVPAFSFLSFVILLLFDQVSDFALGTERGKDWVKREIRRNLSCLFNEIEMAWEMEREDRKGVATRSDWGKRI